MTTLSVTEPAAATLPLPSTSGADAPPLAPAAPTPAGAPQRAPVAPLSRTDREPDGRAPHRALVAPLSRTDREPLPRTDREPDALPLLLLRDELAIDAAVADPAGASRMLPPLVGLTAAGFAVHAVCVAATAWPAIGACPALELGGAWALAATGGFFAAICAGLPSYWFYGVVAKIRAPAWRLAVELVRVQAVGAVVLAGVVPFWLALALGLHLVLGVEVYRVGAWMALTYALPFLCASPGMLGAYRVFRRMRAAHGHDDRLPALALTAWWVVLFVYTAPMAIQALFHALI